MIGILILAASVLHDPDLPKDCRKPENQLTMNLCAAADAERADSAMNRQWKLTVQKMKKYDSLPDVKPDHRLGYFDTLLKAQRAWLTYVEAECASEGYYARGGSLEPALFSQCKSKLTRERTKQLTVLAEEN